MITMIALMIIWQVIAILSPVPMPYASDGYSVPTQVELSAALHVITHH